MAAQFLLLGLLSAFANTVPPSAVESRITSPVCLGLWRKAPTLKTLEGWGGLTALLEQKPVSEKQKLELGTWSSDLLLHLVLLLQQGLAKACAELPIDPLVAELQSAYLKQLGLDPKRFTDADRDIAFRAFMASRDDHPAIAAKLKKAKGRTALELARAVYGHAESYRGAVVVGSRAAPHKVLNAVVGELCPSQECPFWDRRVIYKVLVTEHGGLAAFVPETASLVLSRKLLADDTPLHRLVLIHELAHGAARRADLIGQTGWVVEFSAFSGWGLPDLQPVVAARNRGDRLGKLSKGSPFSLLPDPVITSVTANGKTFEGFALGRTFARVASSGDTSEDFADSVAAYVAAPERFCYKNKPIAEKKFQWIGQRVFGRTTPLHCAQVKNK